MKAGLGLSIAASVAALTAVGAAAQTAGAPATPAPAQQQTPPPGDTVGPRELRDFSLGGTPTRQEIPPAQETPTARQPPADRPGATAPVSSDPRPSGRSRPAVPVASAPAAQTPTAQTAPDQLPMPQQDFTPTVTPLDPAPVGAATALPPSEPLTVGTNSLLLWRWLLAGLAIALGAGLMFFRQRSRRALAGYGVDEPSAPAEPVPPPQPSQRAPARPAVPVQPTPSGLGGGIVSTRLRPWIELEFTPGRCIFDQTQTNIEFLIKITNSGNAPARELRIDAMLFNAGPTQDEEIGAFFAHPPGRGEALDALPPLKGLELPSSVSIPLDRLRILEAAGRQFFVPLVALNARYRWSGGEGQTSFAFLLGRNGEGEKMKPFFTERGPRVFRGVGARQLELKVRR